MALKNTSDSKKAFGLRMLLVYNSVAQYKYKKAVAGHLRLVSKVSPEIPANLILKSYLFPRDHIFVGLAYSYQLARKFPHWKREVKRLAIRCALEGGKDLQWAREAMQAVAFLEDFKAYPEALEVYRTVMRRLARTASAKEKLRLMAALGPGHIVQSHMALGKENLWVRAFRRHIKQAESFVAPAERANWQAILSFGLFLMGRPRQAMKIGEANLSAIRRSRRNKRDKRRGEALQEQILLRCFHALNMQNEIEGAMSLILRRFEDREQVILKAGDKPPSRKALDRKKKDLCRDLANFAWVCHSIERDKLGTELLKRAERIGPYHTGPVHYFFAIIELSGYGDVDSALRHLKIALSDQSFSWPIRWGFKYSREFKAVRGDTRFLKALNL